jgi:glycine cleavage system aminomethyltransferase T
MSVNETIRDNAGNAHRVRCYDNGGQTPDRYTVVYMDKPERTAGVYTAVGMNAEPFHPQGVGQHTSAMPGQHLGRRVAFAELPADCQKVINQDINS